METASEPAHGRGSQAGFRRQSRHAPALPEGPSLEGFPPAAVRRPEAGDGTSGMTGGCQRALFVCGRRARAFHVVDKARGLLSSGTLAGAEGQASFPACGSPRVSVRGRGEEGQDRPRDDRRLPTRPLRLRAPRPRLPRRGQGSRAPLLRHARRRGGAGLLSCLRFAACLCPGDGRGGTGTAPGDRLGRGGGSLPGPRDAVHAGPLVSDARPAP